VRSDDQLRAALSRSGLSPQDREAVLSAVRTAFPTTSRRASR